MISFFNRVTALAALGNSTPVAANQNESARHSLAIIILTE